MKTKSNVTGTRRIIQNGKIAGWIGVSDHKRFVPRKRWEGLTPKEAYYLGRKDAEEDAMLERIRKNPTKFAR